MIKFSRGVLQSNPRADVSQLHHPEAPELVQLSSRRAASTQKQLVLTTKRTVTPGPFVSLQLSLSRKRMRFIKKKKADSVRLETNLPSTMFICSASSCLSLLHSASRTLLCIVPPLVSSDLWKQGVSHSFSAASHFIIPAGCSSCVIEGWFLFMYSSPTQLASPSRA